MAVDTSDQALRIERIEEGAGPSVAARIGLLVYALLVVDASWFPFSGWRSNGVSPLAFLDLAMPRYWTGFDLVTNVVAYVPLGTLAVLALHPLLSGRRAVLAAIALCTLLSLALEAGQTFLPSRVASNLDLLTNASGSALGALFGRLAARGFLVQGRMLDLRRQWFTQQASRGLIVLALWPLAQVYPLGYLFGHGDVLPFITEFLSELLHLPLQLTWLREGDAMAPEGYWLAETLISAGGLTGTVLMLTSQLRERSPRWLLILLLLGSALLAKSMAAALFFGQGHAFAWVTPGSAGGLMLGGLMMAGLTFAPRAVQRRVAAAALLLAVLAVNLVPENPYFTATLQTWSHGRLLNANGAAEILSIVWPFVALWFLWHPVHRHRSARVS